MSHRNARPTTGRQISYPQWPKAQTRQTGRSAVKAWAGRLTLPIILFANVQSLENKMDELHARISMQKDIQDCTLLCFCETWLGERTPDEAVTPDGYTVFRGDRSARESGGGMAILVKQSWCTDRRIISKSCSENVEYLTVRLRQFYLPIDQ
ncbi:hypothetical protein N1851_013962 [Merluccius polli]|uniref:Uncharacterized protein n=1 Tax=Merluccius polli TaxID=89951 RepID=A0AA47MV75_MERPO|nr:hypothetical protein N1851_013962 [Merluccius polli]